VSIIENSSDVKPVNTANASGRGNIVNLRAKYLANTYKDMRIAFKPKGDFSTNFKSPYIGS
jgi:hypothetical protein